MEVAFKLPIVLNLFTTGVIGKQYLAPVSMDSLLFAGKTSVGKWQLRGFIPGWWILLESMAE
jgi:hypothetical protein